jgi:hypothetical protein
VRLTSAIYFAVALTGCTTTYSVTPSLERHMKNTITFAQLRNKLEGKSVQVCLSDGQTLTGMIGRLDSDSLLIVTRTDLRAQAVCSGRVRSIVRVNHFDGAITGLFQGLFGGGFLGWAIGASTFHGKDRGLGVGVSAIEGALLGAIGGGLFGAIRGSVQVYEYPALTGVLLDSLSTQGRTP